METGCIEGQPSCSTADWIGRIEVIRPQFAFVEDGLTPSKDFWLKAGESLRFNWENYVELFHKPDQTCDFAAPTINTEFCQRCRWCTQNTNECKAQPAHEDFGSAPALLMLGLDSTNVIQSDWFSPIRGCGVGRSFMPPQNCTLQLKAQGANQTPLIEARAFVVSNAQTVTYELKELDQSFDPRALDGTHPPVKFWSGTVPVLSLLAGDGLEDNFSTHLHISKVRILKVTKQILPVKGRTVMDAIPVLPSRLVFISNFVTGATVFGPDGNQCYVDTSKADGDFDLTRCRRAIGGQGESVPATPAFLGDSATTDLLTWVVEFRESEGAVQPTLDPGNEKLAIEFTIEPTP